MPKCPDHGLSLDAKPVVTMVSDTIREEMGNSISVSCTNNYGWEGEHIELLGQLYAEGFSKVKLIMKCIRLINNLGEKC